MIKTVIILLLLSVSVISQTPWQLTHGEYKVGTIDTVLYQEGREEKLLDLVQSELTFCDTKERKIPMSIYFPTDDEFAIEDNLALYLPDTVVEITKETPGWKKMFDYGATKNSYTKAAISKSKESYPVVIFSPGYGGIHQMYTSISETLASYGYIVISPSHPYASGKAYDSDKDCLMGLVELGQTLEDEEANGILLDAMFDEISGDFQQIWDHIQEDQFDLNMDLERFAVFGHSLGGMSASLFCQNQKDKICKAAINLDGGFTGDKFCKVQREGSWPKNHLDLPFIKFSSPKPEICHCDDVVLEENYGDKQFYINFESIYHMSFGDFGYVPINQKLLGFADPDIANNNFIANIKNFFDYTLNDLDDFVFVHSEEMRSSIISKYSFKTQNTEEIM